MRCRQRIYRVETEVGVRADIQEYIERYPEIKGDEYHCANCRYIGMCLSLRFAQPEICPNEVLGKCRTFSMWPRCKTCGERKEDIGRDYSHWVCRKCYEY